MFNIEQFLTKFRARRADDVRVREAIRVALEKHIGIEVRVEDITIQPPRVRVARLSSPARAQLMLKSSIILSEINTFHTGAPLRFIL